MITAVLVVWIPAYAHSVVVPRLRSRDSYALLQRRCDYRRNYEFAQSRIGRCLRGCRWIRSGRGTCAGEHYEADQRDERKTRQRVPHGGRLHTVSICPRSTGHAAFSLRRSHGAFPRALSEPFAGGPCWPPSGPLNPQGDEGVASVWGHGYPKVNSACHQGLCVDPLPDAVRERPQSSNHRKSVPGPTP